jgi:hypothetical protein
MAIRNRRSEYTPAPLKATFAPSPFAALTSDFVVVFQGFHQAARPSLCMARVVNESKHTMDVALELELGRGMVSENA